MLQLTDWILRHEIAALVPHGEEAILLERARFESPYMVSHFNCLGSERFFKGHYETKKILPGHIVIEVMGQTGALLVDHLEQNPEKERFLVEINRFRFREIIEPPFESSIRVNVIERKLDMIWMHGQMFIGDIKVADGNWSVKTKK